jgi:hypothetical protein
MWEGALGKLTSNSNTVPLPVKGALDVFNSILKAHKPTEKPGTREALGCLSPKFNVLLSILKQFQTQGEKFRGIVLGENTHHSIIVSD